MKLTLDEVCERLISLDEITLMEELGITSYDIVNKFKDEIEDDLERLNKVMDY